MGTQAVPMETKPAISVVLPVRDAAGTLAAAVESVVRQSFTDWELLIVLDGSGRETREALEKIPFDRRIRIIEPGTARGIARSLNEGVASARGAFIARMDADDICYPERLEKQLEFLEREPGVDLLGTASLFFDPSGRALGIAPALPRHEDICARVLAGIRLAHPTWMGRRDWFSSNPYDPRFDGVEDQELLLRARPKSRYANLPEPLLAYRENPSLEKSLKRRMLLLKAQWADLVRNKEWRRLGPLLWNNGLRISGDLAFFLSRAPVFRRRLDEPSPRQLASWNSLWNSLAGMDPC